MCDYDVQSTLRIPLVQAQREANDLETDTRVNLVTIKARKFLIGPFHSSGSVGMDMHVYHILCARLNDIQDKTGARAAMEQLHPTVWNIWAKAHDQLVEMRQLLLALPIKTFADSVRYNPFKESDEHAPDMSSFTEA
jgi:hypothetical protein